MSALIVPAPLWRRLIASLYDGLLLLGLWMAALLVDFILRVQVLGLPQNRLWTQVLCFSLGVAFFGWFWVRGGQTLGMRAWRLQVRRLDGAGVRWGLVPGRFATMLATWCAAVSPLFLLLPLYAASARAHEVVAIAFLAALGCGALVLLDPRRRAWCDWVAGTEVVVLPGGAAVRTNVAEPAPGP